MKQKGRPRPRTQSHSQQDSKKPQELEADGGELFPRRGRASKRRVFVTQVANTRAHRLFINLLHTEPHASLIPKKLLSLHSTLPWPL